MRNLKKIAKPQVLDQNGVNWTKELMDEFYTSGELKENLQNRYRDAQVKDAVKKETKEKCAYCESKVTHVYPGDIEHIIPKSKFPRLTFTWKNLTLVCYWCNNKKRDFLDRSCMLLNPYLDNTSEHIAAFGPLLMPVESKRGELTIKKLELNRPELRERRIEKIEDFHRLVEKFLNERNPNLKQLIADEIEGYIRDSDFSFTLEQYWNDYKTKTAA